MEKIQNGLQGCYQDLVKDVEAKYDVKLTKFAALGVSAMMHGYLAFDENDKLLVPFRTWRNTITEEASEKLTELFLIIFRSVEYCSSVPGNLKW